MTVKITNISNPASLGVEVKDPDRSPMQFVVLRGTRTVYMSQQLMNGDGSTRWSQMVSVVDPERFGDIPTTGKELVEWARRFVDAVGTDI